MLALASQETLAHFKTIEIVGLVQSPLLIGDAEEWHH